MVLNINKTVYRKRAFQTLNIPGYQYSIGSCILSNTEKQFGTRIKSATTCFEVPFLGAGVGRHHSFAHLQTFTRAQKL